MDTELLLPRTKSVATAAAILLVTGQTPRVDHEADGTVVFEFDQSAEITLQRFLHAKRTLDRLAARGV